MERFNAENKEGKEFGNDVTLIIDLIRHGEKSPAGNLTERGRETAQDFGNTLKSDFPESAGVKAYHSEVPRARETATNVSKDSSYRIRQREGLGIKGKFSPEFLQNYADVAHASGESAALQMYLETGDQRPDESTYSSKEMSRALTQEILHFVEMSGRLKNHSEVNINLISHSGVIENFIADAFHIDRAEYTSSVEGLGYLEGLRITVHRVDPDKVEIHLKFRDREVDLTDRELENF